MNKFVLRLPDSWVPRDLRTFGVMLAVILAAFFFAVVLWGCSAAGLAVPVGVMNGIAGNHPTHYTACQQEIMFRNGQAIPVGMICAE